MQRRNLGLQEYPDEEDRQQSINESPLNLRIRHALDPNVAGGDLPGVAVLHA